MSLENIVNYVKISDCTLKHKLNNIFFFFNFVILLVSIIKTNKISYNTWIIKLGVTRRGNKENLLKR